MAMAMAVDVVPKGGSGSYHDKLRSLGGSGGKLMGSSSNMRDGSGSSSSSLLSSASGLLTLLDENSLDLNFAALPRLNDMVNNHWSEIAVKLDALTKLSEVTERPEDAKLASLIVSKIYFHLEEYTDALEYALYAGERFDTSDTSTYVVCMISKCVEVFIASKTENEKQKKKKNAVTDDGEYIDDSVTSVQRLGQHPRLIEVLNSMVNDCFAKGQYRFVLGVGFESRQVDLIKRTLLHCRNSIQKSKDQEAVLASLLQYTFRLCQKTVAPREFRHTVVSLLIENYLTLTNPDQVSICQCYYILDNAHAAGETLLKLIDEGNAKSAETPVNANDALLTAFQVAFDLVENASQGFISRVAKVCKQQNKTNESESEKKDENDDKATSNNANENPHLTTLLSILTGSLAQDILLEFCYSANQADKMILRNIRANISKGSRFSSVLHSSLITANALMHAGTTVDDFTRWKETTEWLPKLKNWAQFSAIAANGVIHRRHVRKSLRVLDAFLSASGNTKGGACYALGIIHAGSDTADEGKVLEKLVDIVNNTPFVFPENSQTPLTNIPELHGALLGIGLIAMGNHDQGLFDRLYELATSGNDNADVGEAMGYALGLIMLGKGDKVNPTSSSSTTEAENEEENVPLSSTLLEVALNSPHEKVTRSFTLAIALAMYGREEECETIVNALLSMQESVYRTSAIWTLALAYCGTGNHSAIQRCLHVAVSDVSDDCRRSSVTALGFLLHNQPETLPKLIRMLAESFNPHVRYGACMALGLACSGAASHGTYAMEALKLIEPMIKDKDALVRHAALIASAMIVMQEKGEKEPEKKKVDEYGNPIDGDTTQGGSSSVNGASTSDGVPAKVSWTQSPGIYVRELRKKVTEILSRPNREEVKVGAILASGIMDAGGRNCCIALKTRSGFENAAAVVGAFMFCQRWQWEPLTHLLSLALNPTALIGLTGEMKEPTSFRLNCLAPKSKFAYPEMIKKQTEKKAVRVKTAVLSTTAAKKKRAMRREKSLKRAKSKVGGNKTATSEGATSSTKTKTSNSSSASLGNTVKTTSSGEEGKNTAGQQEEASSHLLFNPCRITLAQRQVTSLVTPQRFVPIVHLTNTTTTDSTTSFDPNSLTGLIMLKDMGKQAAVLPGEAEFTDESEETKGKEKSKDEGEDGSTKKEDEKNASSTTSKFTMKDPIARMPKNLNEEPEMPEPFFWTPPVGQRL